MLCTVSSLRQLSRFVTIGVISTIAYALLYVVLRPPLGAGAANAVALALTAVANTQANRRYTFGLGGREHLLRDQTAGAAVYLVTLAVTEGALQGLHAFDARPARLLEVSVLVLASTAATLVRYVLFRGWVFARARARATLAAPSVPTAVG